jgi:hypothetical protein
MEEGPCSAPNGSEVPRVSREILAPLPIIKKVPMFYGAFFIITGSVGNGGRALFSTEP